MADIFLKIFNISITASYLVLAVLLLRLVLKKAPKWSICLLWGLVALRLVMPFSFESELSLIPSVNTVVVSDTADAPFEINTGVDTVDAGINDIITENKDSINEVNQSINNTLMAVEDNFNPPSDNKTDIHQQDSDTAEKTKISIFTVLGFVWLLGFLAMLIYSAISYLIIHRKVKVSLRYRDNIYYCDNIDTSFILGTFKPKIYIQSGMSQENTDYVIKHEKAHLKRCDHLLKPFAFLLLGVYWFNPLIWVAYILLCRDIESACDEKVIKGAEDIDIKGYSMALLNCGTKRKMLVACPVAFGEVSVKSRIKAVLKYKRPPRWVCVIALVLCFVVAICFLTNPIIKVNSLIEDIEFETIVDLKTETIKNDTPQIVDTCNHTWGQWVLDLDASCENQGLKIRKCLNCFEQEKDIVEKLNHKESDWIIDKVAVVGQDGKKHTECIYCQKEIKSEVIAAITKDHVHKGVEWIIIKQPDCLNEGSKTNICSCGLTIETKTIAALGHIIVIDESVEATCSSVGLTEGSHCSRCHSIIVAQKKIDSIGHTMSQENIAASIASQGYTLHYCTKCTYSYKDNFKDFDYNTVTDSLIYTSNNDGTCNVTGVSDINEKSIIIPSKSPDGDTVVSVSGMAFYKNESIEYVSIPDTVSSIGGHSFYACKKLSKISLPKTNITFGDFAFAHCISLENIDLSKIKTSKLPKSMFYGCTALKSVTLNDVEEIGESTFAACSKLESVIYTDELKTIGYKAFYGCHSLKTCRSKSSTKNLDTVTVISDDAFYDNRAISDIVFNKDLKVLGQGAFNGCSNLNTVDFSKTSLTALSNMLFMNASFSSINLPPNLEIVATSTFAYARFSKMVLPDSVSKIYVNAFLNAEFEMIYFGRDLTLIQEKAFSNANGNYDFSRVTADLTVGIEAFENNAFTVFEFPNSTVEIGGGALSGCNNLKILTIPFISNSAESGLVGSKDCFGSIFYNNVDCWDQDEYIPNSLKTLIVRGIDKIDVRDFMGVNIENIVIDAEVSYIGAENFCDATSLKNVYYRGTSEQWNSIVIGRLNEPLINATKYFYSENKPTTQGKYWHYVDGLPTAW